MKFSIRILVVLFLIHSTSLLAQLNFSITTDKKNYDYSQTIRIFATIENNEDTTVSFWSANYDQCTAQFIFDDFFSNDWTSCPATYKLVQIEPHMRQIYSWTIDPKIYGLPDTSGSHKIIGNFNTSPPPSSSAQQTSIFHLIDSTSINAPAYLGGQLNVGFYEEEDSSMNILKAAYSIDVIKRTYYDSLNEYEELWQTVGHKLKDLIPMLQGYGNFKYIEYNRHTEYDSVTVTSVRNISKIPQTFYLSNAYPNPFNPTASFELMLSKSQNVKVELYNSIGERVKNIYSGYLNANQVHTFEITGNTLPSGVYFYKVETPYFIKAKKVMLLK